jgi:uncharacterized repeat protein (TIGR03803 family)
MKQWEISVLWVCALATVLIAPVGAQTTEVVLHNFGALPGGANPYAGVIRDSAGNLYGTTSNGGAAGAGVVYEVDTTGHQTVLYSFTGGADGANPYAGVIRDSAGNLYGTTYNGGAAGAGVVYEVDTTGHQTVLYSFTGSADGANPYAGVIRDSAGNLYGTTYGGGAGGAGVVYKVDTTGHETVLHSFTGHTDGGSPYAGVIRDSAGNLYGTTYGGGPSPAFAGVVYKVDTTGHETVLYSFTGGAGDGAHPEAGVIRDSAGNLYGTAYKGGAAGAGVVYQVDTTGQETVLYSFKGGARDGANPTAGVVRDSAGNLYGTTENSGVTGAGVVYKVDTTGHETVLYSFTGGADGKYPTAGVVRDSAGNLYGTTNNGGPTNAGIVYQVDTTGQETVLHSFTGADGAYPSAGVIRDSAGNLYGTANNGGPAYAGVVYQVDTTGHETVLYSFTGGADGANPYEGVVRDSAGNLYGTTLTGGAAGAGVVYKVDTTGHETVLYSFTGGADGGSPYAGVIRDSAGNLYGTTAGGGAAGAGVVYKVDTTGHQTVLYSFTGGADGGNPYASVIRDAAGNLYGTTNGGGAAFAGVVYKVDTTGHETVLYSFTGGADGANPIAGVIRDSAGNLYGTTHNGGGPAFAGVVYKVDTTGHETVLYSFTGGADGSEPQAGVIRDAAGNLYGATLFGGPANQGVVYKVDTSGHETVLYSFTGGADGAEPAGSVIRDSAGNLYGTTFLGGKYRDGVLFVLR